MKFQKSNQQFKKVKEIIPLGSQTFSKSHLQYVKNNAPLFIEKAKGAYVYDIDNNKFLDMINSLLPVILGYQHPAVDRAIERQLKKGIIFSLPSPLEYQLSKELVKLIPCAEMVRFAKSGSDVTAGAVRLARAITKKDIILCCGYHGWQNWYIGITSRNQGVPKSVKNLTHKFEYNDIESLEKLFKKYKNQVAAVIMEPMNTDEPRDNFLEEVKKLAHRNKALLIFDEIITGFRFDLGGAQKYFKIVPDLACFGKAMANGMPISAVVGRKKYMKKMEDIFFSFTFGGECLSLAAGLATISEIKKRKVIAHIWKEGRYLKNKAEKIIKDNELDKILKLKGKPCWQIFKIKGYGNYNEMKIKSFIQQELLKRGVLWAGSHNLSFSHKRKDINKLIKAYEEVMPLLKEVLTKKNLKLAGRPIQAIFKVR